MENRRKNMKSRQEVKTMQKREENGGESQNVKNDMERVGDDAVSRWKKGMRARKEGLIALDSCRAGSKGVGNPPSFEFTQEKQAIGDAQPSAKPRRKRTAKVDDGKHERSRDGNAWHQQGQEHFAGRAGAAERGDIVQTADGGPVVNQEEYKLD